VSEAEDRLAQFEHGDAIEVPVGRIERELDALWRQAATPREGEKHKPVTRACLWNLIVRAEGELEFRRAKRLIDDLSASLPVRAIVLRVEAGPEALRAWVEANWRRSGQGDSGSDEVTLEARGRAAERLPALVRALTITDVPTAMLWMGAPSAAVGSDAPLRALVGEVDRLIFDSRKLPDEAGLIELQRLAAERPQLELADLAWLGVSPLRGLCAALFDPPPADRPSRLDALERVRVASGVQGAQTRALLTLGWLIARLEWKQLERRPPDGAVRRWRAARRGGAVELLLETRAGGPDHGVVELALEAGPDAWSLTRDRCIEVRAPDAPRRSQPARSHSEPELVRAALGPRGRDAVYREALAAAARLLEAR